MNWEVGPMNDIEIHDERGAFHWDSRMASYWTQIHQKS